jgi:hypothetical protein
MKFNRTYVKYCYWVFLLMLAIVPVKGQTPAEREVGYTELQTNLTGGRHANIRTMRAVLSRADGSGRRLIGSELADDKNSWTQFAGWSPDGKQAIIGRGWQSEANAAKEEAAKSFLFNAEGWLYDSFLVDVATGRSFNTTAVNRVSYYNAGLFFWPDDSKKLGFTALIDGQSHPFRMNLDGTGKEDLTSRSSEFTYGFSASPDGKRITYHKNYQVYLANADGSGRSGRRTVSGCFF